MVRPTLCFGAPNELANTDAVQKDVNDACKTLGIKEPSLSIGETMLTFGFDKKSDREAVIPLLESKYGQAENRETF